MKLSQTYNKTHKVSHTALFFSEKGNEILPFEHQLCLSWYRHWTPIKSHFKNWVVTGQTVSVVNWSLRWDRSYCWFTLKVVWTTNCRKQITKKNQLSVLLDQQRSRTWVSICLAFPQWPELKDQVQYLTSYVSISGHYIQLYFIVH